MDLENFSLEDDDANGLFITQESREIIPLIPDMSENYDSASEFVFETDGKPITQVEYSDISDEEIINVPSSQPCKPVAVGGYVMLLM